jgi:alpha-D-xyloside xylohydrolase
VLAIWSLYANPHVDLVDYTYWLAKQSAEKGTPIVRPMFMAYPDNPEYIDMWNQYLYGLDIMVRPI